MAWVWNLLRSLEEAEVTTLVDMKLGTIDGNGSTTSFEKIRDSPTEQFHQSEDSNNNTYDCLKVQCNTTGTDCSWLIAYNYSNKS